MVSIINVEIVSSHPSQINEIFKAWQRKSKSATDNKFTQHSYDFDKHRVKNELINPNKYA
jgi:hypothetical protein